MPLTIYQQLGLGTLKSTSMLLLVANRSVKQLVGILYDVLVKLENFIFLADFIILDCEVDFEVPKILGRPFLATGRVLVDMRSMSLSLGLMTRK